MPDILHLISLETYSAAADARMIRAGSLDSEGFVHCTGDQETLLAVANAFYRDTHGQYLALWITTELVTAPVVFEKPSPGPPPGVDERVRFPHVYGPIDRAAVVGVRYARRAMDGRFLDFEARPDQADALDLLPHPEGGWYRRTWTSSDQLTTVKGTRAAATSILYMLVDGRRSAWHTVASDELWMWHGPGEFELELGSPPSTVRLGEPASGAQPQVLIPAGTWQRALAKGDSLASCVVCPGFDFADFDMLHQ